MQLKMHRFDRLMSCQQSHSNGFPGPPPELPQLQLFHFPHQFYLTLTSAPGKKQAGTTIRGSSNGTGAIASSLYAWLHSQLHLLPASGYGGYVRRRVPSRPERILTPFSNETQRKFSDFAAGCSLRFALRMNILEPNFSRKV